MNERINDVLENSSIMAIVNHSRWSVTDAITKSNKLALLQQLIWEEVVHRREHNLKAFRKGLNILGIVNLIQHNPNITRPLFVFDGNATLTSQQFISMIESSQPVYPDECQAYERFMEFVTLLEKGEYTCTINLFLNGIIAGFVII